MENPINLSCPWCGEIFVSFFDSSSGNCKYVEDCQVCCRPIVCSFYIDENGEVYADTQRE